MSDPDCCPRCGTFWSYHDETACANQVHAENETLREAVTRATAAASDNFQIIQQLRAELTALREERDRLRAAIRWALGEEGEFGEEPPPLAGQYRQRYWWRTELRNRAGLEGQQTP